MSNENSEEQPCDTLVEVLRRQAERVGPARGYHFLVDGEDDKQSLSLSDLDRRARSLAAEFRGIAARGDRAILLFPPGLEFLEALFGCLAAGLVAVPVATQRPNRPSPQLGAIVENSGAVLVLTTAKGLAQREQYVAQTPGLGSLRWRSVEGPYADASDAAATDWRPPALGPDDLAILQYTSGTTGTAKGVMLTHRALGHNLEQMRRLLELAPETTGVCWLPAFHDMGLIGNLLQAAYTGLDLVLISPVAFIQKPIRWLRAISRYRAFVSGGANFAFDLCARTIAPEDCEGLDLSSWKVAYVGSEPVAAETLDAFVRVFGPFGFRRETFYPCYGLAESTLMVSGGASWAPPLYKVVEWDALRRNEFVPCPGPRVDAKVLVGCGRPVPGLDVRIVDPELRTPCTPGHVGEVWVSGPSVGLGYWQRPAETEATFRGRLAEDDGQAYLRTGDLGLLDDGELYITGRLKEMIIIRGRNHYPQDIERSVEGCHPCIRDGASVAIAVASGPETRLVILQEVNRHHRAEDRAAALRTIRQRVAERFDLEVQTVVLVQAASLPRTSSGKSRRLECLRHYLAGEIEIIEESTMRTAPVPIRTEVPVPVPPPAPVPGVAERPARGRQEIRAWLSSRIARHLGCPVEQIDPALPFAGFGLDSVTMVGISTELERWLSQPLPPTLLYDAPTIEALARHLSVEAFEQPEDSWASRDDDGSGAIAIIGMSGRFPGADSIDAFWELLRGGRDGVSELPEGRWSSIPPGLATNCGGFLRQVDRFDPQFFGIAPREAVFTDPQHRLLLEVAWEALEDGGQAADRLAGRDVGVFIGISSSDYGRMLAAGPGFTDAYIASGNALSLAANRLSYHLDLRGPSLAIDTACSSSLTAIHLACRSLRNRECSMALVGGVNLILSPDLSLALSNAQMLSPTGRCRTFDSSADGYVRGEGCGVVVLKPLAAAIQDGDRILAVIRGSATNQDGKSNGITAPNRSAQVALIRAALQDAKVEPGAIGYVEAHGTGTVLGDPIEFDALKAVFSEGDRECFVSAVKTNIGHLESAAGIAGLIKAVLQLERGAIVPHLHLHRQSSHIDLQGTRFVIPTTLRTWGPGPSRRLAGVSSFGFGGANAHVILEEAPAVVPPRPEDERPAHLLTLSARSVPALTELANRFVSVLGAEGPASLADVAYTAHTGRVHFPQRLAIRGRTRDEVRAGLGAFLEGTKKEGVHVGTAKRDPAARLAFLFTGQGSQYLGMARGLYRTSPVFRASLDHLDGAFRRHIGRSLVAALLGTDPHALERTSIVQPALYAIGSALAELWRSWGVLPAAVLGHSLGEYIAAAVAGVFSAEDGLRLVAERGRLMEELCPEGAMAAVFAPLDLVADRLDAWGDALSIAAINGPANTVISGKPAAVLEACEEFRNEALFAQSLAVSRAFHSPLIEPALEPWSRVVREIAAAPPRIPLISNLTGATLGRQVPDASYWCRHARRPVKFLDGVRWLHEHGFDLFVEIGPTPTLSSLGRACLPAANATWLPSLRPDRDDWSTLLDALGTLEVQGLAIDWESFDAPYGPRRVSLPTYPFERSRYWIELPSPPLPAVVPESRTVATEERPSGNGAAIAEPEALYHLRWEPCMRWDQRIARPTARSMPSPRQLAELVEPTLVDLQATLGHEHGRDLRIEFDEIAAGYIRNALIALGGDSPRTRWIEPEALGVLPKYQRLLDRLLEVLAEDGWLRKAGTAFEVLRPITAADTGPVMTSLKVRYPACSAELTLAAACGTALADVLRGDQDPLQVLFHDGSTALLERIYEESPFARLSNTLVAEVLERALERLPRDRVVRILEIGAGTGGTTSYVLPRLPADRCEYVFTDVSSHFTTLARAKFRDVRFVRFATLDIEREPSGSGFAPHQFDLVLAANVLHATSDLRRSLRNARSLLVPDGLLILIEGTGPQRLLDLIFGLTEGWWKFTDHDLRPDYPLISRGRWADLLRDSGFVDPVILPSGDDPEATRQAVILSRGPATIEDGTPADPAPTEPLGWLIFSDGMVGPRLSEHLKAQGDHCTVVTSGERFDRLGPGHYRIRPDREDDYCTLLSQVRNNGPVPCRRVVDLRGLDEPSGLPDGRALASSLRLAKALGGEGPVPCEEQLWVVTHGAVALGREGTPMALGQSPLWGLGRAIQDARTGLRTRLIDLDPRPLSETTLAQLALELRDPDEEDALAIRHGQRLAARLDRLADQGAVGPQRWRSDGMYLPASLAATSPRDASPRHLLRAGSHEERRAALEEFLRSEFARLLGLPASAVEPDRPVTSFGLDSLMAIQLKNRIETNLGVTLSIVTMLEGQSLVGIAEKVLDELGRDEFVVADRTQHRNGTHHASPIEPHSNGCAPVELLTLERLTDDFDVFSESELDDMIDNLISLEDGLDGLTGMM